MKRSHVTWTVITEDWLDEPWNWGDAAEYGDEDGAREAAQDRESETGDPFRVLKVTREVLPKKAKR